MMKIYDAFASGILCACAVFWLFQGVILIAVVSAAFSGIHILCAIYPQITQGDKQ